MARDYKKEYREYHSKPKQKKRRAGRNKARRIMKMLGRVKKGDGKDASHTKSGKLTLEKQSKNRARNRGRK